MSRIDEFLQGMPVERTFEGKSETLSVPSETDPGRVANVLKERFGSDDELEAMEIVVGNKSLGFVTRTLAFGFAQVQQKAIGAGDYAALPGIPDFRPISLTCPKCGYRLWTMSYDEGHPPSCPHHPTQALEIQS